MKITKFVHSCLLVETEERVGLIDPGIFSWESGLITGNSFERLDDIIITHEHEDHVHLPFMKVLVEKFPNVQIHTNQAVATKLQAVGFKNISTGNSEQVTFFPAAHESTEPLGQTPDNVGFHYLGRLTDPGDSFECDMTKDILALPITAPWGAMTHAAALALDLKPRVILPIHDWHWNTAARKAAYERLADFFAAKGITFVPLVDGRAVEM